MHYSSRHGLSRNPSRLLTPVKRVRRGETIRNWSGHRYMKQPRPGDKGYGDNRKVGERNGPKMNELAREMCCGYVALVVTWFGPWRAEPLGNPSGSPRRLWAAARIAKREVGCPKVAPRSPPNGANEPPGGPPNGSSHPQTSWILGVFAYL